MLLIEQPVNSCTQQTSSTHGNGGSTWRNVRSWYSFFFVLHMHLSDHISSWSKNFLAGCDAINTTVRSFGFRAYLPFRFHNRRSWNLVFIQLEVILAAQALNLGRSWWTVASQVATLANFYLTTWEEYHTGMYRIPFDFPPRKRRRISDLVNSVFIFYFIPIHIWFFHTQVNCTLACSPVLSKAF